MVRESCLRNVGNTAELGVQVHNGMLHDETHLSRNGPIKGEEETWCIFWNATVTFV